MVFFRISFISAYFRLIPFAFLILAVGCASTDNRQRLIAATIAPASPGQIAATHRLLLATSRAQSEQPGVIFSGGRAPNLSFGFVEVSVPAVHKTGDLELSPTSKVADPARYFAARRLGLYTSENGFEDALRQDIQQHDGRALIFVHGFNTSFGEAAFRMTQIVHDSGYKGTPILFTWPSAARVIDYIYDSNSATAARDGLEELLRLVTQAGATRVDIIAHSMGGWVTMEALRQLAITGDRDLGGRLTDVVLASPDIDVDVFKAQMRRYGVPENSFVVLTSRDDRALDISGFLAGNRPRVGGIIDAAELAQYGVVVLDVTDFSSPNGLNHTKFAENPLLIRFLGEGLANADSSGGSPSEEDLNRRLTQLTRGIGQTVGSAAELIVTTPFEVLRIAVGQ